MALTSRYEAAVAFAKEAAVGTLKYFRQSSVAIELKADATPVTQADREAEQLLRALIKKSFPQDGILGEEFGDTPGSSGYRWILDPIDGTKSFIHGVPLFGTLVGIELGDASVIGVMIFPALGESYHAMRGNGAFWEAPEHRSPQNLRVSKTSTLTEGLLCTTSARGFDQIKKPQVYDALRRSAKMTRGWGDCYGHALVARGSAEAMVDPVMNVWDCAALQPIIEEAGGRFTDFSGKATIHGGSAISTNGIIHNQVLQTMASAMMPV